MIEIVGWERLFYHIFIVVIALVATVGWSLYLSTKKKKSGSVIPKISKGEKHTDIINEPHKQ